MPDEVESGMYCEKEQDYTEDIGGVLKIIPKVADKLNSENSSCIKKYFQQKYGSGYIDYQTITDFRTLGSFIEEEQKSDFNWENPTEVIEESVSIDSPEVVIDSSKIIADYKKLLGDTEDNEAKLGNGTKSFGIIQTLLSDIVDINRRDFPREVVNEMDIKVFRQGLEKLIS